MHSVAMLLATLVCLALGGPSTVAVTGFVGLAILATRRKYFGDPLPTLGLASFITVARLLITFIAAAFFWRSYLTLMMGAVLAWSGAGPWWAVVPGLLRYALVTVRWVLRAVDARERRSRWGRWTFLLMSCSLINACLFPHHLWTLPLLTFATAAQGFSFLPDFAQAMRSPRDPPTPLHRALTWFSLALINAALFLPAYFHQEAPRSWKPLGALALEFVGLLTLLTWSAGTRLAKLARVTAFFSWALLLLFLTYHHMYAFFFLRPPALAEDWRLSLNLVHFLSDELSPRVTAIAVFGMVTMAGVLRAVWLLFAAVQRQASAFSRRHLALGVGLVWVVAAVGLRISQAKGERYGVQLLSHDIADNYLASMEYAAEMGALATATPDLRYDALMQVELTKKPNVYWLMIEAYGGVLATCSSQQAYQSLMAYVQERLAKKGYGARTAYSRAPIHSGGSWMSIATVESGIRIDRTSSFDFFERTANRVPTVSAFFRAQGYQTLALQPGSAVRAGLKRYDMYRRHVNVTATELGYQGPAFVFTGIPDQYSVGHFLDETLARAQAPYFVYYMSVSTHYDWWVTPPFVRDWKVLNQKGTDLEPQLMPWATLKGVEEISDNAERNYFRTVEYEWRVLAELIEREASDDAIFFVMGDHQPRLSCPSVEKSFETPVHIISRDSSFLERFDAVGFTPGFFATPQQHPVLRHEGLFSLWVSKLLEHSGEAPSVAAQLYQPQGIGLPGLLR